MTLRGILSLVLETFLLIIAFGTDIREFLIVAACVGGLIFYAFISSVLAVFTLYYNSATDRKDILRGDEVKYFLSLCGPVLLPCVGSLTLRTAEYTNLLDKKAMRQKFVLTPFFGSKRDICFNLSCPHVGIWEVGSEKLRIRDMFGLFSFPPLRADAKDFTVLVSVLPRTYTLSETQENVVISKGYGSISVFNSENGEMLGDSRLYQKGDALKRINWKQTARHKKVFTRQYEIPEMPKILIAIDSSCLSDSTGTIADICCETAISLAQYYINQNSTVHLVTLRETVNVGNFGSYFKTLHDLNLMQYSLLDIPFHKESNPLNSWQINGEHMMNAEKVFILTPNPSDELLSVIGNMLKLDKTVICVVPQTGQQTAELSDAIRNTGVNPIILRTVKEIAGKVGGIL